MSNRNYLEKAAELAAKTGAMQVDLAKKAFDDAASLRRSILNAAAPDGEERDEASVTGCWAFESVELSGIGLRRSGTEMDDYYFELLPDGKAIVCVYGDTYETAYMVAEGCISFSNMELAAMKLSLLDGKLCMRDYLGTSITFARINKGRRMK